MKYYIRYDKKDDDYEVWCVEETNGSSQVYLFLDGYETEDEAEDLIEYVEEITGAPAPQEGWVKKDALPADCKHYGDDDGKIDEELD